MSQKYKILLIIFGCLYLPLSVSKENMNFQNISIHSDQVTIDEETRKLAFKNSIKIKYFFLCIVNLSQRNYLYIYMYY